MKITRLRANHFENPIGYDLSDLTLSWIVEDTNARKQERVEVYNQQVGVSILQHGNKGLACRRGICFNCGTISYGEIEKELEEINKDI